MKRKRKMVRPGRLFEWKSIGMHSKSLGSEDNVWVQSQFHAQFLVTILGSIRLGIVCRDDPTRV
jgi:hypothetical protein